METLKEKTTRGLFWGGLNNVVQQGLGLLFGIILARQLSRQDYGMIAMISIFSLIATALQESGFRNALANLRQPTHRDYNSVFWLNVIVGVSCYVVLFLAAPLIADFYHTPDLILLCRVAFLSIIFSCLGTAQSAYLFRNLKVKEQARCNMISTVVSNLVGLTMAFLKCGYWSLAVQTLVYIGMNTLLLWRASDWRPTFHLDFGPVRRMFRFSFKIMATTILERVNTNVMNVLLGKFFSKPEVGDYNQAYQWSSKVFYLMQGTLGQVAQPVFLSFPLLFGFGMTAREFIVLAIGMKWIHSAELLQLLCMSGAFIPVCSVLTNILISKGKSGIYFWCTFMQCLLLVCTMLVLHPYGIRTMVMAYAVIYILWTFVWHFFVSRLTGYTLLSFLKDILGFALTAFAVMAVTWLITCGIESLLLLLLSRVLLSVVLYFAAMRMFRVKMLDECMTFVTSKIKKE